MRFKRSSDSIRLNGGLGVGVRESVNVALWVTVA